MIFHCLLILLISNRTASASLANNNSSFSRPEGDVNSLAANDLKFVVWLNRSSGSIEAMLLNVCRRDYPNYGWMNPYSAIGFMDPLLFPVFDYRGTLVVYAEYFYDPVYKCAPEPYYTNILFSPDRYWLDFPPPCIFPSSCSVYPGYTPFGCVCDRYQSEFPSDGGSNGAVLIKRYSGSDCLQLTGFDYYPTGSRVYHMRPDWFNTDENVVSCSGPSCYMSFFYRDFPSDTVAFQANTCVLYPRGLHSCHLGTCRNDVVHIIAEYLPPVLTPSVRPSITPITTAPSATPTPPMTCTPTILPSSSSLSPSLSPSKNPRPPLSLTPTIRPSTSSPSLPLVPIVNPDPRSSFFGVFGCGGNGFDEGTIEAFALGMCRLSFSYLTEMYIYNSELFQSFGIDQYSVTIYYFNTDDCSGNPEYTVIKRQPVTCSAEAESILGVYTFGNYFSYIPPEGAFISGRATLIKEYNSANCKKPIGFQYFPENSCLNSFYKAGCSKSMGFLSTYASEGCADVSFSVDIALETCNIETWYNLTRYVIISCLSLSSPAKPPIRPPLKLVSDPTSNPISISPSRLPTGYPVPTPTIKPRTKIPSAARTKIPTKSRKPTMTPSRRIFLSPKYIIIAPP